MARAFYVYLMTNKSGTLYTGITNDLERRVYEHKSKLVPGFTRKYNITRLVYFEEFPSPKAAIEREKQIKGWLRRKKVALIESLNPRWTDLSNGWFETDSEDAGRSARKPDPQFGRLKRDPSLRSG